MKGLVFAVLLLCSFAFVLGQESPGEQRAGDLKWLAEKRARHEAAVFGYMRMHVFRLRPGDDLLLALFQYARAVNLRAGVILTCVGSLVQTNIRYANQENGTSLTGHFEIASLVGTLDYQMNTSTGTYFSPGEGHVHISVGDEKGQTVSGHLMPGNIIYTTAEIAIGEPVGGLFVQEYDEFGSGYDELKVFHLTDIEAPPS